MSVADSVQATIERMVRRIVEQFDPERVILFGSHARGTAGPGSDVDLLVVMRLSGSRRRAATAIDVALFGSGIPKDILVATPEDLERSRHQVSTVLRPAVREGKVLYERRA